MDDIIRVLRLVEYVGPRRKIEQQIENSLHGTKRFNEITIRATTIGEFPEIMERRNATSVENETNT